jgi:hypothetical protein
MYKFFRNNNALSTIIIIGFLLLLPLIAMRFTHEVMWTLSNFALAAVILISAVVVWSIAVSRLHTKKNRTIVGVLLLIVLIMIWIELAVGIFD